MKEKFMDGKETSTQRTTPEPNSRALLIAHAQIGPCHGDGFKADPDELPRELISQDYQVVTS
jgi:hypothetical protein